MDPDKKRLFFAASLGLTAALLSFGWLAFEERRLLRQGEEVKVLAAKRYLPAYSRLQASDLAWLRLPRAFAPTGVVEDASQVLGLQTLVPFSAEEPLIFNKLALGEQSLAAAVPEGLRAINVPVDAVSGLNGLLKPGDHVDLLLLYGQGAQARAELLLQDKAVLAVGQRLTRAEGQAEGGGTVALALSPDDGALALAALANGQLHLALRASGDARPAGRAQAGFSDVLRRAARVEAPNAAAETPLEFVPRKR
jgi:pilus assembly protein CpaB